MKQQDAARAGRFIVLFGLLLLVAFRGAILEAQSAPELAVIRERPERPYIILRTLNDAEKEEKQFWLGCPGSETESLGDIGWALVAKMQLKALDSGADALLLVAAGTSCRNGKAGAVLTHHVEADLIKFVDSEIAERRATIGKESVLDRRRVLQEMFQQTRFDRQGSAEWGVKAYELQEYRWAIQFCTRSEEERIQPWLIAALVHEDEGTARKTLRKLVAFLRKDFRYRSDVAQSLDKLAADLPDNWRREFREASAQIQRFR